MFAIIMVLLLFVVSFLLGSIPFGLVISRVFFHTDIRKHGSGNIGTTNAIRTIGKVGGYAVFVLDFAKGLLSGVLGVVCAWWLLPHSSETVQSVLSFHTLVALAYLGCVWGHIFSPWLKGRGGKGIAVAVGCLFMTFGWFGAISELLIFIVLVAVTRYVSVGSVAAAIASPGFALYFFWGDWAAVMLCTIAGLTVIWAHRGNLVRLWSGTERRVGHKK